MPKMCNTEWVVHLHGFYGVWRQLRPSNHWWRHTFLNDTGFITL